MKNEKKQIVPAMDKLEWNIWLVLNTIMDTRLNMMLPGGGMPYVINFSGRKRGDMSTIEEMNILSRLVRAGIISLIEGPKTMEVKEEWESKSRPDGIGYIIKLGDKFDETYDYYKKKYKIEESEYKLTIYQDSGRVEYTTPNDVYATTFRKNDTSLKLLLLLANYPHKTQSALSICRSLDGMIQGKTGQNIIDDRRIRDAIRHIRKRFGLTENKTDDKLFIVDNKNFGIGCDIEIKK